MEGCIHERQIINRKGYTEAGDVTEGGREENNGY